MEKKKWRLLKMAMARGVIVGTLRSQRKGSVVWSNHGVQVSERGPSRPPRGHLCR